MDTKEALRRAEADLIEMQYCCWDSLCIFAWSAIYMQVADHWTARPGCNHAGEEDMQMRGLPVGHHCPGVGAEGHAT